MSKRIPFLFFIILLMLVPLPRAEALGMGPPSFELDLQMDGSNMTTVYLLSDGLEGELTIGSEDLPFRIEPSKINMSKDDHYRPVELTFYGNETLEPGVYEGMVSFIAQTGGFVALGIKIKAKITLLGDAQEIQEEEPDIIAEAEEPEPDPGEGNRILIENYRGYNIYQYDISLMYEFTHATGTYRADNIEMIRSIIDALLGPEPEYTWMAESGVPLEGEQEASDEEPEPESQEMDYASYVMGVAAVAALVSVVIWWKRR